MQWFQRPGKIDEHDEPTEPWPLPGELPTTPQDDTVPAPHPSEQPFPHQQGPTTSSAPPAVYPYVPPPPPQAYPYAPSSPPDQQKAPEKIKPAEKNKQQNSRRNLKPLLPGIFFVMVQLLLLLRFLLKITGLMADQAWVGIVLGISEIFVLPFRALWLQVPIQLPAQIEIYTLLAVVVYGIISRLLVRTLKIILNAR